jgi:heme exporter protein A
LRVPEESNPPAVQAAGLSRAFGDEWVLREVDLEFPAGATLAVIGPNGAGKSTLLRVLAGLLRATVGEVAVLGSALPRESWRIRGRIGYLGHDPLLYRDLTATENLGFHGRLFGLPGGGADRAAELLEAVGLADRAGRRAGEMSAGMLQRLSIARALLHDPELLVLDEPLAHLDPAAAASVAPLLGPREDRSRVVVTHDVEAALAEADRVLALRRDGGIAFEGPADRLDLARARAIYAEPPATEPVA